MPHLRRALACLLGAAVAAAAAGCRRAERDGLVLKTLPPDAATLERPKFRIRVWRMTHRLRPDAPAEDVWRMLGATNVSYAKRQLWEANDLRLADGGALAAQRLNELLVQTPDRLVTVDDITADENFAFRLPFGIERENLDVVWSESDGTLRGRHFENVLAEYRVVCRSDPDDPAAVRIAIVPEVDFGKEVLRFVRIGDRVEQRMARQRFTLADLAVEVKLDPNRLLVLGGDRSSDTSLGGAFFYDQRGPDLWVQTVVLTAQRLDAVRLPEGTTRPLVPLPREVGG